MRIIAVVVGTALLAACSDADEISGKTSSVQTPRQDVRPNPFDEDMAADSVVKVDETADLVENAAWAETEDPIISSTVAIHEPQAPDSAPYSPAPAGVLS